MNPFDAVISAGASFSVLDMDYPTTKLSACLDTAMFDVCIFFSRQPKCSGKRFVSASLATPEGNADVTSTESHRFRRSRLWKATDAPSAEWFAWTQQQNSAKAVISRRAAVLTTRGSTCRRGPDGQPNSFCSKISFACRGAVSVTMRKTIDNRKSTTITNFEELERSFFR